jgi:hypothetical protein
VLDLMKAKRECLFGEVRRPKRELWINPTLEDLDIFFDKYLKLTSCISYDIETVRPKAGNQITCVGFSNAEGTHGICVPFVSKAKIGRSYWNTEKEEVLAWTWVKKVLETKTSKVAQNGLYDITWLWTMVGICPRGELEDTMLLHHALQPELKKDLGFLGSMYTNEPSWKDMRPKGNQENKDDA